MFTTHSSAAAQLVLDTYYGIADPWCQSLLQADCPGGAAVWLRHQLGRPPLQQAGHRSALHRHRGSGEGGQLVDTNSVCLLLQTFR